MWASEGVDLFWLGLIAVTFLTFLSFALFSRSARNVRRSQDPEDLHRADDGIDRDSPGESPASYWGIS
jgi:hypothetical protein